MSERFKFGDIVENGWAGEGNPRKRGVYLWSFNRTGRMNPGKYVKLLHDDGRTGEVPVSDDGKLTKVGTIFDAKDAEIERLRGFLVAIQLYGSDTLSGRADGPSDRDWFRDGVREMRSRAADALKGGAA